MSALTGVGRVGRVSGPLTVLAVLLGFVMLLGACGGVAVIGPGWRFCLLEPAFVGTTFFINGVECSTGGAFMGVLTGVACWATLSSAVKFNTVSLRDDGAIWRDKLTRFFKFARGEGGGGLWFRGAKNKMKIAADFGPRTPGPFPVHSKLYIITEPIII